MRKVVRQHKGKTPIFGRSTAKTFYAASIFFEIINQFGQPQPDVEKIDKSVEFPLKLDLQPYTSSSHNSTSYRHHEWSCPKLSPMCLVPLPHEGYRTPVSWPESKLKRCPS